jgi:hypothetical protein
VLSAASGGVATQQSDDEEDPATEADQAVAYALFFGVPDGESPTDVEPLDC